MIAADRHDFYYNSGDIRYVANSSGFSVDRLSAAIQSYLNRLNAMDALRSSFFVAAIALVWVSDHPFYNRQGSGSGETERSSASTYLIFGTMAVVGVILCWRNVVALRTLLTPLSVLFVLWMMINIAVSYNTGISLTRFMLTAFAMTLAAIMLLLPNSSAEMNRGLVIAALLLLVLCYFGVAFVPDLSTHTIKDIEEPHLAGDWRGTFGHKNAAAPMMAILVFIGVYLLRSGVALAGLVIVSLAGLFLIFSGGKTSTAICIGALMMASLVKAVRSYPLRASICFVPLIVMNLLSVGTTLSSGLAETAKLLPFDTTYTGRDEIWRFAFSALNGHALTGYGYAAFWDGASNAKVTDEGSEWSVEAANSHNGYLDTTLTLGLPGLIFVLLFFVIAPLKNFQAVKARGDGDFLAGLFLEIWIFGIYLASLESLFFNRTDASWFTFLVAVFGLHYLARFPLKSVRGRSIS